jgi:hypothetical protein
MRWPPDAVPPLAAMLGRALLYALAVTSLVLAGPTEQHVFIYQGF